MISSLARHTTIFDEYVQGIATNKVKINMKYKIVDRKVKSMVATFPNDNWWQIEEVATNTRLQNIRGIGHTFTNET